MKKRHFIIPALVLAGISLSFIGEYDKLKAECAGAAKNISKAAVHGDKPSNFAPMKNPLALLITTDGKTWTSPTREGKCDQ